MIVILLNVIFKLSETFFLNINFTSLLNCASCALSRLRALLIIDTRLTHLRTYALYPSLKRTCVPIRFTDLIPHQ